MLTVLAATLGRVPTSVMRAKLGGALQLLAQVAFRATEQVEGAGVWGRRAGERASAAEGPHVRRRTRTPRGTPTRRRRTLPLRPLPRSDSF